MLFNFPRTLLAATLALSFAVPAYSAEPTNRSRRKPSSTRQRP